MKDLSFSLPKTRVEARAHPFNPMYKENPLKQLGLLILQVGFQAVSGHAPSIG